MRSGAQCRLPELHVQRSSSSLRPRFQRASATLPRASLGCTTCEGGHVRLTSRASSAPTEWQHGTRPATWAQCRGVRDASAWLVPRPAVEQRGVSWHLCLLSRP